MNNITVNIEVPEDILLAANISANNAPADIKKLIALYLFKERILSFGKSCELSGMDKWDFMELAGSKNISLNYDIEDYNDDLASLQGIAL